MAEARKFPPFMVLKIKTLTKGYVKVVIIKHKNQGGWNML
jgi:hypothetical protein